jgi:hypothetical protein
LSHTSLTDKIYAMIVKMVFNCLGKEGTKVKIVSLCREGSCCPVVKLADDHVEIGEEGNLCVLTTSEWETLKNKILNNEI